MRRRGFLAAAGGLTVTFVAGCTLPVVPGRPAPRVRDGLAWVRYSEGRYTLFVPRAEMGQNIATALKQIACEELGIAWEQLEARLHGTADIPPVRATVGSDSVKDFAVPLAQACATLREAIAQGWAEGKLAATERPVSQLRSLRGPGRFVGGVVPLEQAAAIVRGLPLYAADVRRPGMLYGRVLRAPASPELESVLTYCDEAAARAVPGFIALVRDDALHHAQGAGLGIVARTPGALDRIESALAARWAVRGAFDQAAIDEAIDVDARLRRRGELGHRVHSDRVADGKPWDINLRFDIPLAAHAPIEPRAAVAAPDEEGGFDLWAGSQDVFYVRDVVAKRLCLEPAQVRVHGQRIGGAFGGKTICTVEIEAAVLARAARAPVKVRWSRAQEFQLGFHRPASSHRVKVRLQDGRLAAWWHAFASGNILLTAAVLPPWLQPLAGVVGDDGVARGAALPYRVPVRRVEFELVRLPVHTGPWRGLGAGPNGFVVESVIDECARRTGVDPLRFRLDHLEVPRLSGVLAAVAAAAGWNTPRDAPAPGLRQGRGLACGVYKGTSFAAVVADVVVDEATAAVKVTRLWCAHDCGRVVNPDQVRAQCEGNLVWGLGMVLGGDLRVDNSAVAARSFADAPIPRLTDVPPIETVLVESGEPPGGAGETAIVAAAAAVTNAVRDATGLRVTRLPYRPAACGGP